MTPTSQEPWLDRDEEQTWRSIWALMTWLPVHLDSQLRTDTGLSLAEYSALSQISESPERMVRLSELAIGANMTLSHLSRVITRLEKQGWVTRSPDPLDGRFTLGHLTGAGWAKVVDAAPGHVAAVRAAVFENLSAEQARTLGQAAELIAAAVTPGRAGEATRRKADS